MANSKKKVKDIASKIYKMGYLQITIDLIQDVIEEILNPDDSLTPDMVGSASYKSGNLLEAMGEQHVKDIDLLTELVPALDEWNKEITFANKALGLDPNQ